MKTLCLAWVSFSLVLIGAPGWASAQRKTPEENLLITVEKTLQKHGPEIHRCFEKALAERLDVAGRIEMEVQVGKGGKATVARIKKAEKAIPSSLRACVERVAMGFVLDGVEAGAKVVLPFSFKPQSKQYVVKVGDIPDRNESAAGKPKRAAPFFAKVLADKTNVLVQSLSLTQLTVGPASRVAMHRHPMSAKILYLQNGRARILGPKGMEPVKLDEGSAVFIPAGFSHVIENMGRQAPALFLQAFSPPGPERVYRDPHDPVGRAAFEVIRDPRTAQPSAPANGKFTLADSGQAAAIPWPNGAGSEALLLGAKTTGSTALGLARIELADKAELALRGTSEECLYVEQGQGQLKVGPETIPVEPHSVVCLPKATAASFRAKGKDEKAVLLRFAAPAK